MVTNSIVIRNGKKFERNSVSYDYANSDSINWKNICTFLTKMELFSSLRKAFWNEEAIAYLF